jgi:hypothetical protein
MSKIDALIEVARTLKDARSVADGCSNRTLLYFIDLALSEVCEALAALRNHDNRVDHRNEDASNVETGDPAHLAGEDEASDDRALVFPEGLVGFNKWTVSFFASSTTKDTMASRKAALLMLANARWRRIPWPGKVKSVPDCADGPSSLSRPKK